MAEKAAQLEASPCPVCGLRGVSGRQVTVAPRALRGQELLDAVERAFETGRWQGQLSHGLRRGHLFCGRRENKQTHTH